MGKLEKGNCTFYHFTISVVDFLQRRKRFIDQYETFNKTQFKPENNTNARNLKPQGQNDYTEKVDAQTEIDDLFTELYMDIDKYVFSSYAHS